MNAPLRSCKKSNSCLKKRALARIPEEVREPLLEAKKQMRLAMRGFIGYALREERPGDKKCLAKSRHIKLE